MDLIIAQIKKSRDIKDSSLTAYRSALKRIAKIQGPLTDMKINSQKLKEGLKKISITSRKNLLTSLIVALNAHDKDSKEWSDMLKEEDSKYRTFLEGQTRTEPQKKNWITIKEINSVKKKLKSQVRNIFKRKAPYSKKDMQTLRDFFVIMFLTHHYTRLDMANMHFTFKKERANNKNWITKRGKKWVYELNVFKTAKFVKELPIVLKAVREENTFLNKYFKLISEGELILQTQKGKKYSKSYLGRRIALIFKLYLKTKKRIGVSLLRHIYASHILKDEKSILEKKEIAKGFQHSPEMTQLYKKHETNKSD